MDKSKKKKYNKYNASVINALIEKHGFSGRYIRQCVSGERTSLSADKIRKDYQSMVAPSENKVKELLELEERIDILEKSILNKAFKGELGTQNSEDEFALELLKKII